MGRPRQFDERETLRRIMDVFWRNGFDGTSISDLETATGLLKGSLYAAYGNKRAMYLQALELYDQEATSRSIDRLRGRTPPVDRIAQFLQAAVDGAVAEGRGCFLCNASIDQASVDPATRASVEASLGRIEAALQDVLAEMPRLAGAVTRRREIASHLLSVHMGLRVLRMAGQPLDRLANACRSALAMLEPAA